MKLTFVSSDASDGRRATSKKSDGVLIPISNAQISDDAGGI